MLKTVDENYKAKPIAKQVHIFEPDQFGEFTLQQDRHINTEGTKSPGACLYIKAKLKKSKC